MSETQHKIVGQGGMCDYCGGTYDVVKYRHPKTGETYSVCDDCEQSAAGVE